MKKKLLSLMTDKCKDMGLSDKAIEKLVDTGIDGLTDDSSDEDIDNTANRLVPYAKMMQEEGTRWAQKKQSKPKSIKGDEDEDGSKEKKEEVPAWFDEYRKENDKKVQELLNENVDLKKEKTKNERSSLISAKAKELGIPDYLMKRCHIADDADYEKELTDYKQELVTNKLMPETLGNGTSGEEEAIKQAATDLLGECEVKSN